MHSLQILARSAAVLTGLAFFPVFSAAQTWVKQQEIPTGYGARVFGDRIVVIRYDKRAYVYEKDAQDGWIPVADFTTGDPESTSFGVGSGGAFGLFGDTLVIGDPRATVDGVSLAGAMYSFERDNAGNWIETDKITEPVPRSEYWFGENAISMFGDTAILNGSNRHNHTYVVERTATGDWIQSATLIPSDGLSPGYYRAASLFGDTAIVGSIFTPGPFGSGLTAAYVFERDAVGNWNEVAKLQPSDARPGSSFAMGNYSIALYGETAIIGAPGLRRAFVFERDVQGNWTEVSTLMGSENPQGFGYRVRLFGDMATVGGGTPETTRIFRRSSGGNWTEITALDGSTGLFGDTLINFSNGTINIYGLTGIAEGDYNRSGGVDQRDLNLVLANWDQAPVYPPLGWYSHLPQGAIDQQELDGVTLNWPAASGPLDLTSAVGNRALNANFDLKENPAIINNAGAAETVRQQILSGRGGPGLGATWNGPGITSSAAAETNATQPDSRSIGYAENSSLPLGPYSVFHGQAVYDTSILITFTRTGDANLDGVVNDDDVTIVSASYAPGVPQPSWALGDFDYNGFVDDDDVTLLGAFYDPAAAPLISASPANAIAAVPEPHTGMLAVAGSMALVTFVLRRVPLAARDERRTPRRGTFLRQGR